MLVTSHCQAYHDEVVTKAKELGWYDAPPGEKPKDNIRYLKERLEYLGNFGGVGKTVCMLFKDFANLSFTFMLYRRKEENFEKPFDEVLESGTLDFLFNGGLIFYTSGETGVTGQLSVRMDTESAGWQVNT